ncbi:MAG TPA: hypothetical protein VL461_14345 [Dictyobacter sp.]|jgi:hypothetical protein|nr:hypothetical protein [Dictyobacter sp.]
MNYTLISLVFSYCVVIFVFGKWIVLRSASRGVQRLHLEGSYEDGEYGERVKMELAEAATEARRLTGDVLIQARQIVDWTEQVSENEARRIVEEAIQHLKDIYSLSMFHLQEEAIHALGEFHYQQITFTIDLSGQIHGMAIDEDSHTHILTPQRHRKDGGRAQLN